MAKRFYSGDYAGAEGAKSQQSKDILVRNEPGKPANMPTDIKYHPWPSPAYYQNYNLNDGLSGIDDQIRADVNGAKRNKSKNKY